MQFSAQDKMLRIEHAIDGAADLITNRFVLCLEIEQRDFVHLSLVGVMRYGRHRSATRKLKAFCRPRPTLRTWPPFLIDCCAASSTRTTRKPAWPSVRRRPPAPIQPINSATT